MLADATRVQLLWVLADRELSVNDLAARVNKPGPSVSQHLAKLRMAGLVRTRREGTQVFYRLEDDHVHSSPTPCTTPNTPAACAMIALSALVGFLGNEVVAAYRIRVGRRIGSAALPADGIHARADG